MLEAARASVSFYCPGCGAGLRAPRADAGTVLDCERCGEHVRVPRRPHPLECEADDLQVIPTPAASAARSGTRLLLLSILVLLAEYIVLGAAGAYWVAEAGPAAVATRETGPLRPVLAMALVLDLALVAARSVLRWIGYRRCEPAAAAVRTGGWVIAARAAVGLRGVGYGVACLPWILGQPAGGPPNLLTAAAETGLLVWLTGAALEFAILVAWHRLLAELGGREAAHRVTRFAIAVGIAAIAFSCGLLLLRAILGTALVRAGAPQTTPDGQLNLARLPDDVWPVVGWFLAVAVAVGIGLSWQYARVILVLRSSLPGGPGR
jgi:hypothetical protein